MAIIKNPLTVISSSGTKYLHRLSLISTMANAKKNIQFDFITDSDTPYTVATTFMTDYINDRTTLYITEIATGELQESSVWYHISGIQKRSSTQIAIIYNTDSGTAVKTISASDSSAFTGIDDLVIAL